MSLQFHDGQDKDESDRKSSGGESNTNQWSETAPTLSDAGFVFPKAPEIPAVF